jgi:hypothetical protein
LTWPNFIEAKRGERITLALPKYGQKYFFETFVQGSTAVLRLNFCAKNTPLRQAAAIVCFYKTPIKFQRVYFLNCQQKDSILKVLPIKAGRFCQIL